MRKYISTLSLLLVLGFLFFNIYSNGPSTLPPLTAVPVLPHCSQVPLPDDCKPPFVVTSSASSMTNTAATLNGEITALNGAGFGSVGERGFEYGLTDSYGSVVNQIDPDSLYDVGGFSINVASLSCNSTYHYRAYAVNNKGTGYGSDVVFYTNLCLHFSSGRKTTSSSSVSSSSTTSSVTSSTSYSSGSFSVTATPITPTVTVCPMGDKFSTATGLPCTSFEVPPTQPTATIITPAPITNTLAFGSTGDEVKTLQEDLNNAGFNSGPVDGIFGAITLKAVIQFQIAHGLVGDGNVGPLTRAVLNSR